MKFNVFITSVVLLLSTVLPSCDTNEDVFDPTAGLIKITEGYALGAGAKAEVWAAEELFAGYNQLIIVLYDSVTKKRITDAHIHLEPMMDMTTMSHSCPVENPDEEAIKGVFPGAAVFIMPSGDMGTWTLGLHVHNHLNDKEGEAQFDITVANPAVARMKSFTSLSGNKYFLSYYFPNGMKVGTNNIDIMLHTKVGMEFLPVESFTMTMTPEMPSMGHGSPNNVNPVHTVNGHYSGKVNFTMTGEWRLNLVLTEGGETIKETFFDVTLE